MELFLIRHGQSFNNTLSDAEGRVADPPLTETGETSSQLSLLGLRYHSSRGILSMFRKSTGK